MFAFTTKKSVGLGVLALSLCLVPDKARANEEVYLKVAPSTALVLRSDGRGYGTGFLVDGPNRLLVTARHVVATDKGVMDSVQVFFAQTDKGKIINDDIYYQNNKGKLALRGKVVYHSARRDMAIIQLEKLPAGVKPLVLAADKARPGQDVHVIGNSTRRFGGLFGYCQGKVRNTFLFNPPLPDPIVAHVVSHQTPTNKGDSGGPVVNNQGEVVAFISEGTTGVTPPRDDPFYAVQVTDHSICVTEIRQGLQEWKTQVTSR